MNLRIRLATATLLFFFATLAFAAFDVRMVGIVFDAGSDTADATDTITGDESVMYRFRPKKGQYLHVTLRPENDHTEFTVYAPGKWPGEVLHDSEANGSREFRGQVDRDGFHAVSVYQDSAAVTEGRISEYEIVITVTDRPD